MFVVDTNILLYAADRRTAEHGIRRIYARDANFHRSPFLEVIDPLA